MQTLTMQITPAQAQVWLDTKNTRNRTLSMTLAKQYADDMRAGKWRATHQGIAFYADGVLADGQTRLKAITLADRSMDLMVTFGIDNDAGIGIDVHRKRSVANQLEIAGAYPWLGKNEVAVAQQLILMTSRNRQVASTSRIIEFCEPLQEAFMFMKSHSTNTVRFLTTAPVKAALVCAFYYEPRGRLEEFCKTLLSGVMQSPGDVAAVRLREKLTHGGKALQSDATDRQKVLFLTMKAIKLFCKHERISKLVEPKECIYPIDHLMKSSA